MTNQTQKKGLKDRLGAGYAKFGRNGSVWRWEFSWNDSGRGQNGYDNGFLKSNADIFERLKARFVYGVLENANYHLKANYFRLYLVDNERKENDELMISLRFDTAKEENTYYLTPHVDFSEFALQNFSKASIDYLKDVFANYALKLKGKYFPNQNSISSLIKQANANFDSVAPQKEKTLQELYADAVRATFANQNNWVVSMLKCTVTAQDKETLLLNFPEYVSNEQRASIDSTKTKELTQIVHLLCFSRLEIILLPEKSPQPQPVAQADTVEEIKKIIPLAIQDKQARGGEPKSLSKFLPKKDTYQKTPAEVAFLEQYEWLVKNERTDEAKQLFNEFYSQK